MKKELLKMLKGALKGTNISEDCVFLVIEENDVKVAVWQRPADETYNIQGELVVLEKTVQNHSEINAIRLSNAFEKPVFTLKGNKVIEFTSKTHIDLQEICAN